MAGGFLKAFDNRPDVSSAGTQPGEQVHPKAIQVMKQSMTEIRGAPDKSGLHDYKVCSRIPLKP